MQRGSPGSACLCISKSRGQGRGISRKCLEWITRGGCQDSRATDAHLRARVHPTLTLCCDWWLPGPQSPLSSFLLSWMLVWCTPPCAPCRGLRHPEVMAPTSRLCVASCCRRLVAPPAQFLRCHARVDPQLKMRASVPVSIPHTPVLRGSRVAASFVRLCAFLLHLFDETPS